MIPQDFKPVHSQLWESSIYALKHGMIDSVEWGIINMIHVNIRSNVGDQVRSIRYSVQSL